MKRTQAYRRKYISEHHSKQILEEFPILKLEHWLLKELDMSYTQSSFLSSLRSGLKHYSDSIINMAITSKTCPRLMEEFKANVDDVIDDDKKQVLISDVCCLVIPLLFGEKDVLYVVDKEPVAPTPTIVFKGRMLETHDIGVWLDGTKICHSSGVVPMFAAFYVYGVEYPKQGRNTLYFLQQHIAGLGVEKAMPQKVQRFINNITQ